MKRLLTIVIAILFSIMVFGQNPMKLGTNFWNFGWGTGWADYYNSGVNWSTVTNPWRQKLLDELSIYSVIRFMDQVPTNSSNVVNWSERTAKTANHYSTSGGAVAYEWQIDLCNRLNADIWITVPHKSIESYEANATSNYFTELAKLLKAQLKPELNIYLEYSNETWSGGASFQQGDYCGQRGVAMGFDDNAYTAKFYFHVYAATRLHKVFMDEFADQPKRLKKVISGQDGSLWGTQMQVLAIQNKTFAKGNKSNLNPFGIKPDYHTIANYISTGDGSASNIRTLWTNQLNTATEHYQKVLDEIKSSGMQLIAYEGGQHYTNNAHTFSTNPQSYDMYMEWLEEINKYFVLTCHYTHTGTWGSGGAWGAKNSTDQSLADAHRYRALKNWVELNHPSSIPIRDENQQVIIYPNPCQNELQLHCDASVTSLDIQFLSTTGVVIKNMQQKCFNGKVVISTESIPAGLYILIIRGDNFVQEYKLLIDSI